MRAAICPRYGPPSVIEIADVPKPEPAVVEGVYYALTYIEKADLPEGSTVLVYGGGGAVGSAAVQLFASRGVVVTAVAEEHQLELMGRLGASATLDYRAQDFTTIGETFDLVFDAVGKTRFDVCRPLIRPGGMFMATELGPRLENLWLTVTTRFTRDRRVHFPLPRNPRAHVKSLGTSWRPARSRP